jgi:hypothetical protein
MRRYMVPLSLVLVAAVAAADPGAWVEVGGGAWKPPVALLSEVEAALMTAIPPAAVGRGRPPEWHTYTFQYQGQTSLVGHRYVRINAFCDSRGNHPDLANAWVEVFDGGACFFSAKYDVVKKRLYDVQVNGVA